MPRKKIGLEQRLNFWGEPGILRLLLGGRRETGGEKVSELLRHVLDRAQNLFDKEGNFISDLPMSADELRTMMREVAREESRKVFEDPTIKKNLENQWEDPPRFRRAR